MTQQLPFPFHYRSTYFEIDILCTLNATKIVERQSG
jgi:hypothetical protein